MLCVSTCRSQDLQGSGGLPAFSSQHLRPLSSVLDEVTSHSRPKPLFFFFFVLIEFSPCFLWELVNLNNPFDIVICCGVATPRETGCQVAETGSYSQSVLLHRYARVASPGCLDIPDLAFSISRQASTAARRDDAATIPSS